MSKLLAVAAVLAVAGCKKKEPAPAPPPSPGTADAATAPSEPGPDAPDEDALRAGKRTGLGGSDEQPEVATEAFARALLTGATPWSRVVSPSAGVVELAVAATTSALGRRCGPAVTALLGRYGPEVAGKLALPDYELSCDNADLVGGEPRSAICSLDGTDPPGYDLIFVPDPTLGLRLVGVTAVDGTVVEDAQLDAFDLELARTGKLCP